MATKKVQREDIVNFDETSFIMNNTYGWLCLFNETSNRKFPTLKKYGDSTRAKNSDIVDMNTNLSDLFLDCYALVKGSPALIEHLGLTEIYKYVLFSEKEMDELLSKSEQEITDFYENCPKGMREILIKFVKIKIERGDGVVDSSHKSNFLQKLFKIDFSKYWKESEETLKLKR